MAQRMRTREAEKSKLILSINWKEEMLLQKRLSTLDSLKRQVADSYTLDQRVLYNRFRTKLRRSELAHARLMGRQELIEQLKSNVFSSFNTTVTDDSKAAVREILQGASRDTSVSARHKRTECPLTHSTGLTMNENHFKRNAKSVSKCSSRVGTAVSKATQEEIGKNGMSQFPAVRPHTTTLLISPEQESEFWTHRPYTAVGGSLEPSQNYTEQLQSEERGTTARVKSVIFNANADESKQFDTDVKGASQRPKSSYRPKSNNSDRAQSVTRRDCALNVFLNIGERELKPSLLEIHANLTRETRLEDKVESFIEQVQAVRQHGAKLNDYYSERLLAMGTNRSRNLELLRELEKDTAGWDFVGKELNYRSVTFKKLDWGFC